METVFLDFKENDLWLHHAVFLSSLVGLHQELKLPTHCSISQFTFIQQTCQALALLEAGGAAISTARSLTSRRSKPHREFRHTMDNDDIVGRSLTQDSV